MEYYLNAIKNYANFRGRARRSEYWYFILLNTIISTILTLLDFLILRSRLNAVNILEDFGSLSDIGSFYYPLFSSTYYFFSLIPAVSVTVRRLHDVGYSGGYYFVPIVASIYTVTATIGTALSGTIVIPALILVGVVVWFLVMLTSDSESGENVYGPNPKGITSNTSRPSPKQDYMYAPATTGANQGPQATFASYSPQSPSSFQNIPEEDDFLFNKCLALIQNEEYAEANKLIARALQVDPGNAKYKKLAVLIEDKVARNNQLHDLYKKAEENYYRNNLAEAYAYANKLIELDSHPNSLELHQKIERAYKSENEIQNLKNTIRSLLNTGDYRNAEKSIAAIKSLTTDSEIEHWDSTVKQQIAAAEYDLANRFFYARDFKQAAVHIENAFSRKPQDQQILELRSKIILQLNRKTNIKTTIVFVSVLVFVVLSVFGVRAFTKYRETNDAWLSAFNENTRNGYNEFILKFPDSEFSRYAQSKIDSINKADNKEWADAIESGNYLKVERYLNKYTDGINITKAENAMDSLLWLNYKNSPTKDNVQLYLNSQYAKKYVTQAQLDYERLEKLIITDSEKELYNDIILNYFQNLSNKDYSAMTNDFELIVSTYIDVKKADKGKIINYHTTKRTIQREEFRVDPISIEFKRDENYTTVTFKADYFVNNSESNYYSGTGRTYEVRSYTFQFNENNRIVRLKYKAISRTKIEE